MHQEGQELLVDHLTRVVQCVVCGGKEQVRPVTYRNVMLQPGEEVSSAGVLFQGRRV